jgi:hypothetical protein
MTKSRFSSCFHSIPWYTIIWTNWILHYVNKHFGQVSLLFILRIFWNDSGLYLNFAFSSLYSLWRKHGCSVDTHSEKMCENLIFNRWCLLLLGIWSHLRYIQGSVLAHLFLWLVISTCVLRLITLWYPSHFRTQLLYRKKMLFQQYFKLSIFSTKIPQGHLERLRSIRTCTITTT